jgi:5-methylcytosine-specific restriction endonuclease McrA
VIEHTSYDCTCTGKRCPGCEQVKCRGAFDRSLLMLGGLQPYCRGCRLAKRRESRPWLRDDYKEANRKASKQWRQNHREDYLERNRVHQERNREKYREQSRAYHEANRDKHREQMRAYQRNNLVAFAVRNANRHARKVKAGGSFTPQEWEVLKAYYDYTCLRCGRQEPEIELTIDHVVPLSQGGRNSIENLQPLCRTCNFSKHTKTIDYRPDFRR